MTQVSLRRTSLVWMTALLTLVGASAMVVAYAFARNEAADFLDGQLRQVALNAGRVLTDADAPAAPDQDPEDQIAVTIWKGGAVIRNDLPGSDEPAPRSMGFADHVFADHVFGGETWRTYTTGNAVRTVRAAQRDLVRREFARSAALGSAAPILLVIPLSWIVVGWVMTRMLSRLDALARDVAERSAAAATLLSLAGVPIEVAPLVESMNGLIVRSRAALDTQKRFLADAAHALRTPLAAMQIQVDNLASGTSEDLSGRTAAVAVGVRRASVLVDQLLRLARLDAPAPIPACKFDLGPVLLDCVSEYVVLADLKGVDLGACVDATVTLDAAEADMRVLLANLIDNAVRYTPAGGRVDVRLHSPDANAVVEIGDTGCGLPTGSELRIFDRFYRAAPPGEEGSGLGLAIAKRIAERNGLGLTVENRRDGRTGVFARVVLPT